MNKPTATLTPAARNALIDIGTRRQGATISPLTTPDVTAELRAHGYIGQNGGLTRAGSTKREILMTELLDAMF